jgi:diacylglycerol O-acyltransferase
MSSPVSPTLEKLRPDDHFLVLLEGDETPMHIGSVLVLDIPESGREHAAERLREHLVGRLGRTPLLRTLHRAPLGFDSDVWVRADDIDVDRHVTIHRADAPMADRDVHAFVETHVMRRLDLTQPPFAVQIIDPVADGEHGPRIALYVRVHHALTDGVGFQHLLSALSDDDVGDAAPQHLPARDELPSRHEWLRQSSAEFRARRPFEAEFRERRRAAVLALRDPELQRSPTPECALSGPTSNRRAYDRVTVPFDELHRVARALQATVNDLFLAIVGTVVRDHLVEADALPDLPIVSNSARSYRRPEHGLFGNRIVAIHPHLATDIDGPLHRLRAIQDSMAVERRRTGYDEVLLNQPETPFGPMTRRARFASRRSSGSSILPGNVTVSNVAGPQHVRTFAGYPQRSNHPAPLLGSGRALNFTARRNAGAFDVGVMSDPTKIADVARIAERFRRAFALYATIADGSS